MKYRYEIDGLRALAVLPVLFFHAGFPGFSGGFVGVDIFFVISGFLITNILISENEKKLFSTVKFYERRARRLIPAFAFILFTSLLLSVILLPASEFESFGNGLVFSSSMLSNYFFLSDINYFSLNAEERPLLHIWSLSVEEQFYIGFPLVLLLSYKLSMLTKISGRNFSFSLCVAGFFLSLIYMLLLDHKGYNDIGFFSVFSRAWELLTGALVAFLFKPYESRKFFNNIASSFGLGLIIFSLFFFDRNTDWPSIYTTIPVFGTALLLAFTHKDTFAWRILSCKSFVFIGTISYSLYLWHQPIFAFLRVAYLGHPTSIHFFFAIILSTVLAFLSWKYIELPFRNKDKISGNSVFLFSILSLTILGLSGAIIKNGEGFPQRYSSFEIADEYKRERPCLRKGREGDPSLDACIFNKKPPTWAVVGDSHSNEFALSLSSKLPNEGVHQFSMSACSPSLLFRKKDESCHSFSTYTIEHIISSKSIKNVVLVYRHSLYLKGDFAIDVSYKPKSNVHIQPLTSKNTVKETNVVNTYKKSFYKMINKLLKAGKNVYITTPIPELKDDIKRFQTPVTIFNANPKGDIYHAVNLDTYQKRQSWWFEVEAGIPDRAFIISAWDNLCGKGSETCSAVTPSGKLTYFDDDHLTVEGIAPLVEKVISINKTE